MTHIKVGRAQDVATRLESWKRQCPSKRYELLGSWPVVQHPGARERYANTHRLERLILLELKDYATNVSMRHPKFPIVEWSEDDTNSTSRKCIDCEFSLRQDARALFNILITYKGGTNHTEIFTFRPVKKDMAMEVMDIVAETIERWASFVQVHM